MLSDRLNRDGDSEINMTPMLDVVFILLIFFIVSTSFVQLNKVEIERPQAATAEASHGTPSIISLDGAGRLYWQGKELDIYYLPATLRQLAASTPNAQLLIMADQRCPTGVTIKVLDIANQSGLKHTAVAADQLGSSQ
ncbi:ExbD/TolR family protein [Ferrimonas senticii]|uniref:ExbD/TolR family protein n=1 Tax=Ferrimonas senticii TaxID=394566 RepID=UPI00042384C7|nr:biopolymer transporter ExbD [Ferrimonas senticii]